MAVIDWDGVTNIPIREKILDYIEKTTLPQINGESPYIYDLGGRISRDVTTEEALGDVPCCEMAVIDDPLDALSSSKWEHRQLMIALLFTIAVDERPIARSIDTQLEHLLADAQRAMRAGTNGTHGDRAHATYYEGFEANAVEGEPLADLLVRFRVDYSYDYTDPHNATGL